LLILLRLLLLLLLVLTLTISFSCPRRELRSWGCWKIPRKFRPTLRTHDPRQFAGGRGSVSGVIAVVIVVIVGNR
jgi:hypothetical protein